MYTIIALCLVGAGEWQWSGFSGKSRAPVASPVVQEMEKVVCSNADCICPVGQCYCEPGECNCGKKAVETPPVVASPPPVQAPPAPPQRWRLTDANGQVWEFTDRERLIEWVKAINASVQRVQAQNPPTTYSPPMQFEYGGMQGFSGMTGGCAGGQCSN